MDDDGRKKDRKPQKKWIPPGGMPGGPQKPSRSMALWVMLIILFFLAILLFNSGREREWPIDYSQFVREIENGNVASVKIKGLEVRGKLINPAGDVVQSLISGYNPSGYGLTARPGRLTGPASEGGPASGRAAGTPTGG